MNPLMGLQAPPWLLLQEALLRPAPRKLLLRMQLALIWARWLRRFWAGCSSADFWTAIGFGTSGTGVGGFGASSFGGGGKMRLLA